MGEGGGGTVLRDAHSLRALCKLNFLASVALESQVGLLPGANLGTIFSAILDFRPNVAHSDFPPCLGEKLFISRPKMNYANPSTPHTSLASLGTTAVDFGGKGMLTQ